MINTYISIIIIIIIIIQNSCDRVRCRAHTGVCDLRALTCICSEVSHRETAIINTNEGWWIWKINRSDRCSGHKMIAFDLVVVEREREIWFDRWHFNDIWRYGLTSGHLWPTHRPTVWVTALEPCRWAGNVGALIHWQHKIVETTLTWD